MSKRNVEFFFVPAVACNRTHTEKKRNRYSAHLLVFLLSHAREEKKKKSSAFARSLRKKTHNYRRLCACVYYKGAYEWMTEDRWSNDDNNRSVLLLLFVVHLTFFIIDKNSIATSGLITMPITTSIQVNKRVVLFFIPQKLFYIETCSKINCSYSSIDCTNTINEYIWWTNSMSFMWLSRSNKININWKKWL